MTSNPADSTPVANDDAHDKLLAAIGTEAQTVAETSAGQASTALVELSRAYALVTSATTFRAAARYAFREDEEAPLPIPMRVTLPERTFVLQQIPAPITTPETPAATEARDALLTVIGTTARNLQKYPGQASTHLAELARAYTLVTTRDEDMSFSPISGTMKPIHGFFDVRSTTSQAGADAPAPAPAPTTIPAESPAAAEARDQLLTAIGTEAQNLTEQPPAQASAQLKELARAYAHLGYPHTSGNRLLLESYPDAYIDPSLRWVPASEVNPEDIAALSIEYPEGQPVIVVRGGKAIPAGLMAVDPAGNPVAGYAAGAKAIWLAGLATYPAIRPDVVGDLFDKRAYNALDGYYVHQPEE
ncbi:hypothetical protein [Streptomyces sp. RerS4]|uniref:hypothetical protein n=1 Tax=Streptomyces sp. RerS4 TaxID=2942449 RepID=UPI00201C1F8A|nr:hypothetical protein [Streptomyces sp. RerS4]UQX04782.1 hypothetical protein M4D82_32950 [Streptomyces sp. RerS4]